MSECHESIAETARTLYRFGDDVHEATARLVEDPDRRRYVVWKGPTAWRSRIDALVDADRRPALLDPVDDFGDEMTVVLGCPDSLERFDIWKWRHCTSSQCIESLSSLATTISTIHQQQYTLGGLRRSELLFDPSDGRLYIAALPRLQRLDDDPETIWRDIRLFAELAYENFLEHEYPGDHRLVELLRDRSAVADTGITTPGLGQLLAGCVSPYGELAYRGVDDLIEGLDHLRRESNQPLLFDVGTRSTQGNYIFRQNNQDSCSHVLVDTTCGSRTERVGFFCVADGIGGIADGERASSLAVQTASAAFLRTWRQHSGDELQRHPTAFARAIARITSQRLAMEGNFGPGDNRGGTTFTGLLVAGGRAGICHVGDSRAVLVRDRHLVALTRDHTLASILERLGESPDADDDTSRRTIARFMSTTAELDWRRIDGIAEAAASRVELEGDDCSIDGFSLCPGDRIVLTTDGAHDELTDRRLGRLANLHGDDAQKLADSIVDCALKNIGRDNATALVVAVD